MIDYTLAVASPVVYDPRVKRAQSILQDGNVFGQDFHRGIVDGEFGEETGRSCVRAKYWLGYATKDLKPVYGPALDSFLLGEQLPTTEMGNRAALRERKKGAVSRGERALAKAVTELGYKESPAGSNMTKFGQWYGVNGQPWCAIFTSWCYEHTGSHLRYAYVPYIVNDARAGRNGLQPVHTPLPGDLCCYDWDGGVADHVGLFRHWVTPGATFHAVEGNTAVGNDSNGGEVMNRIRQVSQVVAFVRVGR